MASSSARPFLLRGVGFLLRSSSSSGILFCPSQCLVSRSSRQIRCLSVSPLRKFHFSAPRCSTPTNDAFQDDPPPPPPPVNPDDPDGELEVYRGILSTQVRMVKSFSLMTSVIGLAFQPILFLKAQNSPNLGLILGTGAFLSFFTFATPLLIHHVSKKYVTELRYNKLEDKYTAFTYSFLLRKKQIQFKLEDVQVPDIPGMFTTFKANNTPLFVDGQQFYVPQHYGKIMGYDKPLNFRIRDGVTESQANAQDRWSRWTGQEKQEQQSKDKKDL